MTVSLRELQENFQAYILSEEKNLLKSVATDHDNAIERIDVYKYGYVMRLLETLEKDLPVLRAYLGEDLFEKIGRGYVQAYPSDNFSICIFSRHFSRYLIEAGYDKLWSEMAAFEWALGCALDAADSSILTLEQLGSVAGESWPYLQFSFHPSLAQYSFHYNAPQITLALMLEQEAPEVVHNDVAVDWIVWRSDLKPYFESIAAEKVWMIQAISQDSTFAEICEGLCQWLPEEEVAQFAAGTLGNWISRGMLATFKVADMPE